MPAPKTPFARRLEHVRKDAGIPSLRGFWERLARGWIKKDGRVSYESARYYHYDRVPPATYLARVAKVFDVRIEWLMSEQGEMKARTERMRERQYNHEQELTAKMLSALGRPLDPQLIATNKVTGQAVELDIPRPLPLAASWAFPLLDLIACRWDQLATSAVDAGQELPDEMATEDAIVMIIATPLRALSVTWENLGVEHRNTYILSMIAILAGAISNAAPPALNCQTLPTKSTPTKRRKSS